MGVGQVEVVGESTARPVGESMVAVVAGPCVAGEALGSVACDGGDDAGGGVDAADAVVGGVGDVEIAGGVEGDGSGEVELGGGCGGVVSAEAGGGSGDGGDDVGGEVYGADAVVVGVGDVEGGGGEGEALWGVELGGGGGAVVAGEALGAGSGDGGDVAEGVDLADDVVAGFGDVEIAGGVEDYG